MCIQHGCRSWLAFQPRSPVNIISSINVLYKRKLAKHHATNYSIWWWRRRSTVNSRTNEAIFEINEMKNITYRPEIIVERSKITEPPVAMGKTVEWFFLGVCLSFKRWLSETEGRRTEGRIGLKRWLKKGMNGTERGGGNVRS